MPLQSTLTLYELLERADIDGARISQLFAPYSHLGIHCRCHRIHHQTATGNTDFIHIMIPGSQGKTAGGRARTLGIIGRNGAIAARPARLGMVSDADGVIAALAVALKLAKLRAGGDQLAGDVIVSTHLSTQAPLSQNDGIAFMGMPVDSATMNRHEVDAAMDAILSLDASKGNSIVKHRGFAISPTAMQGYILRVAPDLVRIMESTTGQPALTFPISQQDITPYDNGLYHFNSIMQPHVASPAPVVGVAITAQSVVGGSDSSANHEVDLAEAVRFCVEVAKRFTRPGGDQRGEFYDAAEWQRIRRLYPDLSVFQHSGA
jgi:hypothetical protein